MADQNGSNNKRGMNSFADDIDQSSVLTELERIGARASRKGIQRTTLEDRIKGEGKQLNSLLEEGRRTPEFTSSPFYQEQTTALRNSIRGIRKKMNTMDNTARERAESEASTYISREFSQTSINGQVSGLQKEAATQNRAFSMSGMSYDQLSAAREDIYSQIRVRERQAQSEVKGMFSGRGQVDPEKSAALGVMMSGTQEHFRQIAQINAAQVLQRANGNDPSSRLKSLAETGNSANEMLNAASVAQEVRSGGVNISKDGAMTTIKNGDINSELMVQAKALSEALKGLADGAGKTDEELAKLRAAADESADNFKKLQEAQKAGGGGFNGVNTANFMASGLNALGGAAQQIMVGQRMQEVSNIGGFANLANQQYDMYKKARGGDVASQLALSQFGEADDFGMEMKRATNIAQTAYVGSGIAQTAAGGLQAANAVKNTGLTLGLTGSQEFMSGATTAVQGVATTATVGADMARGTSANAARLAGIQASMQARMAINAIPAEQMQGLRNFYTDLDVSSQEMGAGANAFLKQATSKDTLEDMQSARMSPEQFAKLAQQGGAAMGTTFNQSSIFQARAMESAGFGNSATNIQRMATLAQAGGNNPQASMQGVMEAAFTKSLDSSKALSMMVENTAAMAAGTSAATMGIDTTAATATMLAAGVNGNMSNKEAAINQAMTAAQMTQQVTTNRSATFTGMLNTAAIQKATGISGVEAIAAQGLTIQDYKSVQNDPQKAMELYRSQGINIKSAADASKFTNQMLEEKQDQILRDRGLAINVDTSALSKRMRATGGDMSKLSDEDQLALGQMANLGGRKGGAGEMFREFFGVSSTNSKEGVSKAEAASKGEGGDLKKELDTLRTSGFKQLSEAAATAAKEIDKAFGKDGSAVKFFSQLTEKYEKNGLQNEEDFSKAGGDFAKNLTTSFKKFNEATDEYSKASREMIKAAGLISNRNPVVPQSVSNALDQMKGRSK